MNGSALDVARALADRRSFILTSHARPDGDAIVLEGRFDGVDTRWSFSDITPSSFRWWNRQSTDGGRTWRLVQHFDARRA